MSGRGLISFVSRKAKAIVGSTWTPPSGTAEINGDIDAKGNHLLNDQTTTNMMSKGTVYRFDAVDDYIDTGESFRLFCAGATFII